MNTCLNIYVWFFECDIKGFGGTGVCDVAYPHPSGVLRGKGKDRDSPLILKTNCWLFSLCGTNSLPLSCCFPVVKIKDLTVLLRMQSSLAGLLCRLVSPIILPFLPTANLSRNVSYQVPAFPQRSVNLPYSRCIPLSVGVFLNGKIISVNELRALWNPVL